MYLYCGNNPVTNQDPLGDCWHRLWIFGDCASCKAKKEAKAQVIDATALTNIWSKTRVYEIDKGKEGVPGYYYHYHLNNHHGNPHIWHYGNELLYPY